MVFGRYRTPPGYMFLPSGNVYITRNCRRLAKESGRTVYAVYVRTFIIDLPVTFLKTHPFRSAISLGKS